MQKVHWLKCLIDKLQDLKDINHHIRTIHYKWSTVIVKKAKYPFTEGAQRISYHGQRMNYRDERQNEHIVIKEFKHVGCGGDRRSDYIEIMETQCVAAFMATEFNKVARTRPNQIFFMFMLI